jgi:hypothetical protein
LTGLGFAVLTCREKLNSMDLLRYMAPVAVVLLVPATLIMEPDALSAAAALARADPSFVWMLLLNSSLAYLVNLTNFLVTKHTSPLTLQVSHGSSVSVSVALSLNHCALLCTLLGILQVMLMRLVLWSLQVLGNAKGAVAVVVSILIFRNPVTVMGMLGYGVTILGVVLYGEAKKRSK